MSVNQLVRPISFVVHDNLPSTIHGLHLNYNASRDGDWSSVLSADLLFVNTFFLYHRMTLETCESRETPHLLPISVLLTHPQTDSAIQ